MKASLRFLLACLAALPLLVAPPFPNVSAETRHATPAAVGFQTVRIPNGNEPPLLAGIWYPTRDVPSEQALEDFNQVVAPSGAVEGRSLPLIVISHGGGGTYGGHYDTALALARAGFVVAAVSHAGDTQGDESQVLMQWRRPVQLTRLIDYMLDGWSGRASVDRGRIGAFGFSNGGFTVLVAAGGVPDFARIDSYCVANPAHNLCTELRRAGVQSIASIPQPADAWAHDRRIQAVAAAAPAFAFTFDRAGLASVRTPVLLWRAADDGRQPHPWYEEHVRSALPLRPEYRVEPGAGHFAFLPPCNPELRHAAPDICIDAPGFDRAAFHQRLNADLVRFFEQSLRQR